MTIEEIGSDFVVGLVKMNAGAWSTCKGAATYCRGDKSPFMNFVAQAASDKIDAQGILRQMGITEEMQDKIYCAILSSFPNLPEINPA